MIMINTQPTKEIITCTLREMPYTYSDRHVHSDYLSILLLHYCDIFIDHNLLIWNGINIAIRHALRTKDLQLSPKSTISAFMKQNRG